LDARRPHAGASRARVASCTYDAFGVFGTAISEKIGVFHASSLKESGTDKSKHIVRFGRATALHDRSCTSQCTPDSRRDFLGASVLKRRRARAPWHLTPSLAVIDCHSLGIYTAIWVSGCHCCHVLSEWQVPPPASRASPVAVPRRSRRRRDARTAPRRARRAPGGPMGAGG
jgi:hypothetical protein